jgi:hypothetical protein
MPAMDGGRDRRRAIHSARMLAAWLGLHALLLQLLLPVFHHPAHVFAAPSELAASLIAMESAPVHGGAHHGKHGEAALPDCPLCLAVQHQAPFVPPTAPALALPQSSAIVVHFLPVSNAARWHNLSARARGPPLAV